MSPSEQYRKLAAEFTAKSRNERNARLAEEWENLARCYRRLSAQADSNSSQDIWIEAVPKTRLDEGEGA